MPPRASRLGECKHAFACECAPNALARVGSVRQSFFRSVRLFLSAVSFRSSSAKRRSITARFFVSVSVSSSLLRCSIFALAISSGIGKLPVPLIPPALNSSCEHKGNKINFAQEWSNAPVGWWPRRACSCSEEVQISSHLTALDLAVIAFDFSIPWLSICTPP